jgi:hypothetical protein
LKWKSLEDNSTNLRRIMENCNNRRWMAVEAGREVITANNRWTKPNRNRIRLSFNSWNHSTKSKFNSFNKKWTLR